MNNYTYTIVKDSYGNKFKLPFFMTQQVIDDIIQKFIIRDDDVFITTYPRSGTTWMQQIVHLLTNQGIQGDKHLELIIPYLEKFASFEGIKKLEEINDRRFFKTHLHYTFDIYKKNSKAKFIYIARNPKDCAVSLYYFISNNSRIAYDGLWDDFFKLFITGDIIFGGWFEHVIKWWSKAKESDNILFIKYEDMYRNLREIITKIVEFINIPITIELMDIVIDKSSFANMSKNSNTNLDWASWRNNATTRPLRKGSIGDWKNYFTNEQNAIFDEIYQKRIKDLYLQFDFE